jgi:hypothetical protein
MVTLLDIHTPDILLLTETPMHPHQGSLARVLNHRGYKTHYHAINAPSPPGTLPKARLPTHTTHNGGGSWIAYKKNAPWASTVRNLHLPDSCTKATTCAIELTLHSGEKAAIISCYLPQTPVEHSQQCKALAQLPNLLKHQVIILGGDLQGSWNGDGAKDANIRALPYRRWDGHSSPTFLPPSKPDQATCIDHLTIWDPKDIVIQSEPTLTIPTSFLDHSGVLGRASLPLLIPPATPTLCAARTPRVPTFKYPIHPQTLAA